MKLVPLDRPELFELVARWLAQKENYQWLDFGNGRQPVTPALLKIMAQRDTHFLRVCLDRHDNPTGISGLNNVDRVFRTATFWGATGEKSLGGRGFGTVVGSKFLSLAFRELGLAIIIVSALIMFSLGWREALIVGVALIIWLIIGTRFDAFMALLTAAVATGLIAGVAPIETAEHIATGFGNTLAAIGIVIGLGVMIGKLLEVSGGADALALAFLRLAGRGREDWAMTGTGAIVSVPVFCDSGYVIMHPLSRSLSRTSGRSFVTLALALGAGMTITHHLVPPTPGPLAVAGIMDVDLGQLIIAGLAIGIPMVPVVVYFAKWMGPRLDDRIDPRIREEVTAGAAPASAVQRSSRMRLSAPRKNTCWVDCASNTYAVGSPAELAAPVAAVSLPFLMRGQKPPAALSPVAPAPARPPRVPASIRLVPDRLCFGHRSGCPDPARLPIPAVTAIIHPSEKHEDRKDRFQFQEAENHPTFGSTSYQKTPHRVWPTGRASWRASARTTRPPPHTPGPRGRGAPLLRGQP